MSRHHSTAATGRGGTHQRPSARECACGHPTRNQAFVCDDCLDGLSTDLRELLPSATGDPVTSAHVTEIPGSSVIDRIESADGPALVTVNPVRATWCDWPRRPGVTPGLWADLRSVIAGERGVDYRQVGGRGATVDDGDAGEPTVVETGIVLNEVAADRARQLRNVLRGLVVACMANRVDHTAPAEWAPRSTAQVPAMAEWLSWRVTGMAWHPEFASAPGDVQRAVDNARGSVMPAPFRQFLGACDRIGCRGTMRAARDDDFAVCDKCGTWVEARALRDWLIGELEERLCTAAEIADLFDPDPRVRPAVRKRLNKWAQRNRLLGWPRVSDWAPGVCAWPAPSPGHNVTSDGLVFRFGDAFDLLLDHERRTREKQEIP